MPRWYEDSIPWFSGAPISVRIFQHLVLGHKLGTAPGAALAATWFQSGSAAKVGAAMVRVAVRLDVLRTKFKFKGCARCKAEPAIPTYCAPPSQCAM
jgi:hypothetical protein